MLQRIIIVQISCLNYVFFYFIKKCREQPLSELKLVLESFKDLKGYSWQYIFILALSVTTFEVTTMLAVKFLITCLVSEMLKDKKGQRLVLVTRHL